MSKRGEVLSNFNIFCNFETVTSFETHIGKLEYLLGVSYLYIPERIVKEMGGLKCGRLICTLNDKESFQCGFMSLRKGDAYITVNKARMTKLKLKIGDQVKVELEKDESEYGLDMCDEMKAYLEQDDEALERFKMLSPGMQRSLIYHISQPKSTDKRIERTMTIFGNMKEIPQGKENFRALLGKN